MLVSCSAASRSASAKQDANKPDEARLKPAYRFQRDGWVYVHLEGSPADIGYQHGYLLAPEIEDGFKTVQLQDVHRTKRDWDFYRQTAQNILWPHIDAGISAGIAGHRRRPEGPRFDHGLVGRGGAECDGRNSRLLRSLAQPAGEARQRTRSESAGQLQRVRRHRIVDQRPQAGDRAQQLDRLSPAASAGRSSSISCRPTAITC